MSYQVGLLPPESLQQALADLSRHPSIGGWKELACYVRPDLAEDPEAAGSWMHRALDPNARDVWHELHMRRALRRGHQVDCHIVMHWLCDTLNYRNPEPIAGKSRRVRLLEEDERIATRRRQIAEELEGLDASEVMGQIKAVAND